MIEAIELTSTRRSRGGPVEKVSFDVYPGQVTALLGAPGTGKSTVLRLMVELESGGGRTLFGGRPFRALRPAIREVGLALNPDALHPGRTVQAHLQLYSAGGGVPKGRIAEVLEVSGLSTQATVRCGRLDPGQRQRLSIAAALLGDPAALILDEPYTLDSHGMSWFHALIRAYAAQGRTVLVAATDPDSLSGTADHVVILRRDDHDGVSRVVASRSAAEVFDERRVTVVQVRSPQAARLAAALEKEGARLSPAGPGALQVRGLDRARIGEVAHIAGICLHELSEISHDEDVFGLRPVPRQKELLPGLNRAEAVWRKGVRLVVEEIEEAEVVEEAEAAEPAGPVEQPVAASVGAQAKGGGATAANGGAMSADVGNETPEAVAAVAETQLSQGTIASPRESATGNPVLQDPAKARWRVQSSQWWAVKSVAEQSPQGSSPVSTAEQASDTSASVPAADERVSRSAGSTTTAPVSSSSVPAETEPADGLGDSVLTAEQRASHSASSGSTPTGSASASSSAVSVATERVDSLSSPTAERASSASIVTAQRAWASGIPAATELTANSGIQAATVIEQPGFPTATELTANSGIQAVTATAIEQPASPAATDPTARSGTQAASATAIEQPEPPAATASPTIDSIESPAPQKSAEPPIVVRTVEAPALRRSNSFGLRWGRDKSAASQAPRSSGSQAAAAPAPVQPAVPFTVAAPAAEQGAAEGMTPWRAVAVRAGQHHQQQVSVAEAAPAEQETSA